MSRIGKKPVVIPEGTEVNISGSTLTVKSSKGELKFEPHPAIGIEVKDRELVIFLRKGGRKAPALWGLTRSLAANMIEGVSSGYEKKLEFEGVGYRASMEGNALVMQLGFSHPVRFQPPEGVKIFVEKNTIIVSGIDKELVGNTAARIRALKPPEPYKGKGIRYKGEIIRRKAGKKAIAAG